MCLLCNIQDDLNCMLDELKDKLGKIDELKNKTGKFS